MNERETMIEKTRVMLAMQNEMNAHVDADWRQRDREWYRAIWIECAELMDHYGGWKWWKHSTPDFSQVVLEIVDIWHFGLSMYIDDSGDYRRIATTIIDAWHTTPAPLPFLEEVERLAFAAVGERRFAVGSVRHLLAACDRDFDDLYRSYVAKNVLNMFRQDHGYKRGDYIKIWHGREDNEVLSELINELDSSKAGFRDAIYQALSARYTQLKGPAAR